MDAELYQRYVARHRAPGEPFPRLLVTRCDDAGVHHARLHDGHLSYYTEYVHSRRGMGSVEVEASALAALDGALAKLPAGVARCARERTLLVGFTRDGAWVHRMYDLAEVPDEVLAVFDALGGRRPPRFVEKVPRRRRIASGHEDYIEAMALSRRGLIATGSRDGGLVRDLATGKRRVRFCRDDSVDSVAFVGETVAWCSHDQLRVGQRSVEPESETGTIVGGDPNSVMIVQHHGNPAIATSPDGRLLAAAYFDARATVTLFELPGLVRCGYISGHTESVTALAFSPDSQTLATADGSREVRLWSVATDEAPRVVLERCVLAGGAWALAFSPDGTLLAGTSSDGLCVWTLATGERADRPPNIGTYLDHGRAIAWSPDGRFLADAHEGGVVIWDVASWRECGFFETRDRPVAAAFASRTELVVACEESIGAWDLAKLVKARRRATTRSSSNGPRMRARSRRR